MKKFLLSLAVGVVALTASAGGNGGGTQTPYWFTVNVETAVQPTGAGKVYCSFESADAAKANETTAASKHFSAQVSGTNWGNVTQTVLLYSEGEGNYELDHYEVNGQKVTVTDNGYGDGYKIAMTQANNCGAGDLAEDDCVAQHSENLAGVVTHIVGVFKEIEKCWFYTSASVQPVENGEVYVSFESSAAAKENKSTSAFLHFNKSITPTQYDDVTKTLFVSVTPDAGYELESLTVNGADMTASVDNEGNVGAFIFMSAANKCGDGSLDEDACGSQHNADLNASTQVSVVAKFASITKTGVNDLKVSNADVKKVVENGQVIIVKGENRYNTMGQSIK